MADNPYERDDRTTPPSAPSPDGAFTTPEADDAGAHDDAQHDAGSPGAATTQLPAVVPARPASSGQDEVPPGRPASSADDAVTSTFDLRDRPGQNQAERPVPHSGLTEHRSAGYLTGELDPRETDAAAAPADLHGRDDELAAPGSSPDHGSGNTDAGPDTAVILEGATTTAKPPSRAGAHVWTVLLTLLLTPVAWYLLADAGARLTRPAGNPWDTGQLNVAALLELAGGLLVLAVVLLAARWSSLGAIVTGSLVLVVGVPFLAVPQWTQEVLEPVTDWLATLGDLGDNIANHLVASGSTGRLVVYGLALILVGAVSHGARRRGRREVRGVLTP